MKLLAVIAIAVLQFVGAWPHLPTNLRHDLATASSDRPAHATVADPRLRVSSWPVRTGDSPLALTAGSAYAIDESTDTVLYSQDANQHRPIASITKLVTTMVILSRHQPSQWVTVPKLPIYAPDDELIGLRQGEQYTVRDLVTAALVQSGDDAADAMALWDAGSAPRFAAEMNAKMKKWGITDTHFASPSGLQNKNNYATAAAVAKIARLALADPIVAKVVAEPQATITSKTGRVIWLQNINTLLATGDYYGIKTGYTGAAGECFVGLTRIDGHNVITVVLDSSDRFGDTQSLVNWISMNWKWL